MRKIENFMSNDGNSIGSKEQVMKYLFAKRDLYIERISKNYEGKRAEDISQMLIDVSDIDDLREYVRVVDEIREAETM